MAVRYDDNGDVYEVEDKPVPAPTVAPIDLPETDDIKELMKSAMPHIVRKAIQLAHSSGRLSDVMSALNAMADRVYGKAHQSVEHTGKITHETLVIMRTPVAQIEGKVVDAAAEEIP